MLKYKLNITRPKRIIKNSFFKLEETANNYLNDLCVFNFNEVFQHFKVDNTNPFILHFTNHITVINTNLSGIFVKRLVPHLKQNHGLKIETFNFEKMRQILKKDFKDCNILSIKK